MLKKLHALGLLFVASLAFAQTSPMFYTGQVPTAGQWNQYFAGKLDFPVSGAGNVGNVLTSNGSSF